MNQLDKTKYKIQLFLLGKTCKELAELDLNENDSFIEMLEKNKTKLEEQQSRKNTDN